MSQNYDVITFKADSSLTELLKGVPNRSEFIRSAILSALSHLCPFCKGSGLLTPHKKECYDELSTKLKETECDECDESVMTRQKVSR